MAVTANHCASVCASTVHQLCFCSFVSTVYEVCISCASTDPDRSSGASQISVRAPKPNLDNCVANNHNPPGLTSGAIIKNIKYRNIFIERICQEISLSGANDISVPANF